MKLADHVEQTAGVTKIPRRAAQESRILIVRHGQGRGPVRQSPLPRSVLALMVGSPFRRPRDMDGFLDHLAHREPALRQRIAVWETGSPPPDLENVRAVFFRLQDPLRERFPECFREANEIAQQARRAGIRVLNPPDALSNSIKSVQSKLWRAEGIPTPEAVAYESFDEMLAVAERVAFPALVRADQQHGWNLILVDSPGELARLDRDRIAVPGCLVPLVDTRESYRQSAPESEYAKFYHKKRVWVVGDRVQPGHVFFSRSPLVWCRTSTFSHYKSLNPVRRFRGRLACGKHLGLDYDFFRGREPAEALLRKAARVLGFDVAAIDYSTFADGRIVLWEANPCFFQEQWPIDILRHQRRTDERHSACNDAIGDLMRELVETKEEGN